MTDGEKRYQKKAFQISLSGSGVFEKFDDGEETYVFDPPVLIQAGATYRIDDGILYIVKLDGELVQVAEGRQK